MAAYIQLFKNIGKCDGVQADGKNASLSEMFNQLAKKGNPDTGWFCHYGGCPPTFHQ